MDFEFSNAFSQNGAKRARLSVPASSQKRPFDLRLQDDDANQADEFSCPATRSAKLPIDWSLKTRVRFISKNPFPWNGQFKAVEDAAGVTAFVRCIQNSLEKGSIQVPPSPTISPELSHMDAAHHNMLTPRMFGGHEVKSSNEPTDSNQTAILRKFAFVWMYPNFPWISLFPRIDRLANNISTNDSAAKQDALFKDSKSATCEMLRHDWCVSLRSLYNLLKTKHCPYFYVCDNSFTILFRAAGLAGIDNIHAIISNSTSGLRKMLKEDGIEFTMPLMEGSDADADELTNDELGNETVEDSGFPLEEDSQIFLESLGLSQQDFPSMKSARKTNKPKEDKTKTMLYIKGTKETSLLLSFLSNTSMIVPSTGRLTGIPPTLLAPVAFNGASLHSLKLKLSQITHNGEPLHNLDLIGPVLPTVVNNMSSFFCNTLDSFRSKLVTYDSSAPFATFHSCPLPKSENLISLFATENLKECGLTKQLVGDLCRYTNQSKTILNEIVADSNGYMVK